VQGSAPFAARRYATADGQYEGLQVGAIVHGWNRRVGNQLSVSDELHGRDRKKCSVRKDSGLSRRMMDECTVL